MNCSQTLPLAGMFFLLMSCGDLDGKPLDSFQEGDVRAKAGDIELTEANDKKAGSELYIKTYIHPRLRKMMRNYDGAIEERYSVRFASELRKSIKEEKQGFKIYGGSSPKKNNGINLIVTQHIGLNKDDAPYKLTVTVRQGSYYWEKSLERIEPEKYNRTNHDYLEGEEGPIVNDEQKRTINILSGIALDQIELRNELTKMLLVKRQINE